MSHLLLKNHKNFVFLSWKLIVLAVIFRSVINFELIVSIVRDMHHDLLLSHCSSTTGWKKLFHSITLAPLFKISWHVSLGLFLDLTVLFYVCLSIIMPIPHHLDCCNFVVSFEVRMRESSYFVLTFQDSFGFFGSLTFPYASWNQLVNLCPQRQLRFW